MCKKYGWESDILFVPYAPNWDHTLAAVLAYSPDVIALSFKSYERNLAFETAAVLKQTGKPIWAGGIHPTVMPQDLTASGLFDLVVKGDGVGILKGILAKHLCFNGDVVEGQKLEDSNVYLNLHYSRSQIQEITSSRIATIVTTHGCPFNCRFCYSGRNNFFLFPIEGAADNVKRLYSDFGVRLFRIQDDVFACDAKRIRKFRKALGSIKDEISFGFMHGRVTLFNREVADELASLDIDGIAFGIESASPRILKFLNKEQTLDDCYRAAQLCKEYGHNMIVHLMYGIPTQNQDDYQCNIDFMMKIGRTSIKHGYFCPYPGTPLYDSCFLEGYMPANVKKDSFGWYSPVGSGTTHEIQIRLNGVDYELADEFIAKTKQLEFMEDVYPRMEIVDDCPWVFVGGGESFFFVSLLREFSTRTWKNCLGYFCFGHGQSPLNISRDTTVAIPRYSYKEDNPPRCVVTSYTLQGYFNRIIAPAVGELFGHDDIPIISIASYHPTHTKQDVLDIVNRVRD